MREVTPPARKVGSPLYIGHFGLVLGIVRCGQLPRTLLPRFLLPQRAGCGGTSTNDVIKLHVKLPKERPNPNANRPYMHKTSRDVETPRHKTRGKGLNFSNVFFYHFTSRFCLRLDQNCIAVCRLLNCYSNPPRSFASNARISSLDPGLDAFDIM